jgi:dihydrofolate synthase/folylpolyglutamate synthase
MPSAVEYVESLSPWPQDGFGLERIRALLASLGDPQLRFPSIHVVGTNGKSTVTRTIEALLAGAGLSVGSYVSPHVRGWSERIRVDGEEADFEAAIERVRDLRPARILDADEEDAGHPPSAPRSHPPSAPRRAATASGTSR